MHANGVASEQDAIDTLLGEYANALYEEPTEPKGTTLEQAKDESMLTKETNTEVKIGDDTVWIPAKFKVHEESADTVDEGIIITDASGNEFVWVPVDDASFNAMFSGSESTTMTLCGSTGKTTNYYSNLRVRSEDSSVFAATTPGTTSVTVNSSTVNGVREPDLVTDYDSDSYAVQAGYDDLVAMAQGFVDDYKNMRASIEKYDGFYIGRYELTGTVDNPTVQAGAVLTANSSQAKNWYGLYKACRNVVTGNDKVTSTMIWGCQWDETMNWLGNCGYNVDSNSTTWGNYNNSSENAALKEADGTTNVYGNPQNTGYSKEYWSANNICDLAGNYYEWTQEASNTSHRVARGRPL